MAIKVATINDILATRAKMKFAHRVNFESINYDNLSKMELWCQENCVGIWRVEKIHALYFQFEEDRDATMFMLKWGGKEGNKLK
jgi:hypothetical protein